MEREIIKIDRKLCNGCGVCIPNCHEGALQMIDNKATLVSELMCDGLGACIGHCPQGAITIEKRNAEVYNEIETLKEMLKNGGRNVVFAHLKHLKDYKQKEYIHQAFDFLKANSENIDFDVNELIFEVKQHGNPDDTQNPYLQNLMLEQKEESCKNGGCSGSASRLLEPIVAEQKNKVNPVSELTHWPVQMHLINPSASFFKNSDLLLASDCVAFSMGDFHSNYLKNKTLAIACPKLDSNKEIYIDKLINLIDEAKINTLTVMKMEVPCCGGTLQMAQLAREKASRNVPIKVLTVSTQGKLINNEWV